MALRPVRISLCGLSEAAKSHLRLCCPSPGFPSRPRRLVKFHTALLEMAVDHISAKKDGRMSFPVRRARLMLPNYCVIKSCNSAFVDFVSGEFELAPPAQREFSSFSNCVSSRIGTPSDFALSSFDPGSAPTTT